MRRTIPMPGRVVPVATMLLLAVASAPAAGQPRVIEAGQIVSGPGGVETRNDGIRVGDEAVVEGPVRSHNGRIQVGARSEVGALSTRNGAVAIGASARVDGGIETRNGRIDVGEGATIRRHVVTRNGPIEVAPGVRIEGYIDTRNGRVELGDDVHVAGFIESRNGRVRLGEDGRIGGDVRTRNGGVGLAPRARIEGSVESRNGTVRLDGARVARDVEVRGGDVEILDGSEIRGDLIVLMPEERDRWLSWLPFGEAAREPVVRIHSGARIGGRLIVDERARLEIEGGADVPTPERPASREAWRRR